MWIWLVLAVAAVVLLWFAARRVDRRRSIGGGEHPQRLDGDAAAGYAQSVTSHVTNHGTPGPGV